jgi:MOSC domain-containing protein YiiM
MAMSDATIDRLQEGFDHVQLSPSDGGVVELIVLRPREDEREVVAEAELRPGSGVVGDRWSPGAPGSPETEVTVMNARCIELLAGDRDRWPLAGDQLYVDLDLSESNLPSGSRLRIGTSLLEVSEKPHRGCSKFSARFGADALRFVNSTLGRTNRLRGLNARVVEGGAVRCGDSVTKV